jgi:hypothetical protein
MPYEGEMTSERDLVPVLESDRESMLQAFDEIQMSRTPFELENFVVGSHHTEEQQYAHCVLELSLAYDSLRIARLEAQKKQIEIKRIDASDSIGAIDREIKSIEQEQLRRAVLGKLREFEVLYKLWKMFPKQYTREELNAASEKEFTLRLQTQAQHDLNAHGSVSVGNQEGLRQIGVVVPPRTALSSVVSPIAELGMDEVERRYLAQGRFRVLVGVPTEKKAENGLPCLNGLNWPAGAERKIFNNYGNPVADAYNFIVREALNDEADYLVTVEDDTFPPPEAVVKLLELLRSEQAKGSKCAVGAWYPKKEECSQGVHIIAVGQNERGPLKPDGLVHEVYTMAMGCSIYPVRMFREIPYPWFKTTAHLTQDSYFSQQARDAGWKLLVDTSIRCKHVDRITGKVYE